MQAKSLIQYMKNLNTDKLRLKDQVFVFQNLVDLLKMGISVKKSLDFIMIMKPELKIPLGHVTENLKAGFSFSKAFRPYVSTNIYYQLEIADQHGGLEQTLTSIANIFSNQEKQRKKIRSLVQYPVFLIAFLGMMMIGMRIYIMPELMTWNNGTGSFGSRFVKILIGIILGLIVVLVVYKMFKFKQKSMALQVDILCRIPIFGNLYRLYCHYYLSANLAFLISSGMSTGSICSFLTELDSDSLLFQIGSKLSHSIRQGKDIGQFIQESVYLPLELNLLIQKGSKKETLSKEVHALSQIKYQQLVTGMERLILIIQPVLFGIIGIVIVVMYLNLLMPMYNSMKEVTA